jgi:hypothetical protein
MEPAEEGTEDIVVALSPLLAGIRVLIQPDDVTNITSKKIIPILISGVSILFFISVIPDVIPNRIIAEVGGTFP